MHPRLGSATLSQLAFSGEGNPNIPWQKSHWEITVVKVKKKKGKYICNDQYRTVGAAGLPVVWRGKKFNVAIFSDTLI